MEYQIQHIQNKLQELRSLILIFKNESAVWLASAINKLEVMRVELSHEIKPLINPRHRMTSMRNIQHPLSRRTVTQRAYWALGQLVGAPVRNFFAESVPSSSERCP